MDSEPAAVGSGVQRDMRSVNSVGHTAAHVSHKSQERKRNRSGALDLGDCVFTSGWGCGKGCLGGGGIQGLSGINL